MRTREIKITKEKLNELAAAFRNAPIEPIGECLSDDEFIRYAREELSEEESDRIDKHLESCEQCLSATERLIEGFSVWHGEQGKQRLDEFRLRCRLGYALNQAQNSFSKTTRLAAQDKENHKIWNWHNEILNINVIQDNNGDWIFWFSSNDLSLQDKKFYLHVVSLDREVTLKRVSQNEVGAKITIPSYERPTSIDQVSFDINDDSFNINEK